MNTLEYIKYYTEKSVRDKYQILNGTVKRVHTNGVYDIVTMLSSEDYPLFNIPPIDPAIKYSVGDSITLVIPIGNVQLARILGLSNVQFPIEEIIEFNEPIEVIPVYLYIVFLPKSYGTKGFLAKYSTDGTLQWSYQMTDLKSGTDPYYICKNSSDLYIADSSRNILKYTADGSFAEFTVNESTPFSGTWRGIITDGSYLYQSFYNRYIARTEISSKTRNKYWIDYTLDTPYFISGNSSYLILSTSSSQKFLVFDYSGNFVKEISTGCHTVNFTCDEETIYFDTTTPGTYTLKSFSIADGTEISSIVPESGQGYNLSMLMCNNTDYLYRGRSTTGIGSSTNIVEIYNKSDLSLVETISLTDVDSGGIKGITL